MERRELLKTLTAAVAAAVSTQALAAEAGHEHEHHMHHHTAPATTGDLIRSSVDCLQTGEACLAHCLTLLSEGNPEMAACAQSVNELLATCTALFKLASQNSKFTPALAKLAGEVCTSCEKECRRHEKKHAECKACADACAACSQACQKVTA